MSIHCRVYAYFSFNYVLRFCIWLVLLASVFWVSAAFAQTTDNTLRLGSDDARYDINSAVQGSGFFPCEKGLNTSTLTELTLTDDQRLNITSLPKFKQHPQYCFFIKLHNQTSNTQWALHLSNFFIDEVKITLWDKEKSQVYLSNFSHGLGDERLNVIGRAIPLNLQTERDYTLMLELAADGYVAPPYIGLMSESYYQHWSAKMGNIYTLSIGVILGLILVAVVCAVMLKDITFFWFAVSSLLLLSLFSVRSYLGVYVLHTNPVSPVWLWAWSSAINISVLLFSRSFLTVGSESSAITKIFDPVILYFFACFLLCFILPRNIILALISFNTLLMMGVIFYTGIIKVIHEGRYYLVFMLGWVPVLLTLIELFAIVFIVPERHENTLSYKVLREPFVQLTHMLLHFIAMMIRIDDLKRKTYQAELKSEAKSRFLASVSHDLRQPLHSMSLFLAHLSEHIASQTGKNLLDKVYRLHASMNDSFKTLMNLSRLEAGEVNLNIEPIDLKRFSARMRLEFEPHAHANGLNIRFRSVGKQIHSDPLLLERIVRNLVTNAIKYTRKGCILVAVRRRSDHVLIQVCDTGLGISRDDQKVIFDIYKRSDKVTGSHSGMGIGLAIVKHLVELLGGEITLKSEQNRGTVFKVKFPLNDEPGSETGDGHNKIAKPALRIVLNLNNPQRLNDVSRNLQNWGYLTSDQTVSEGRAAITLVVTDSEELKDYTSMAEHVKTLEKNYGQVVIALLKDGLDQPLTSQLSALNIHPLASSFRPAQLRSLLRYLEGFLSPGHDGHIRRE